MNYLFIGNQPELKRQAIDEKKKELLSPSNENLNFNLFYTGTEDTKRIKDTLYTLPFLSKTRLVVIKDFHKAVQRERDLIISYLKKPAKSTCLILDAHSDFKKKNDFSDMMQLVKVRRFDRLKPSDLNAWVNKELSRMGKTASRPAVELLKELVGEDLGTFKQEIKKLAIFTGKRQEIGKKDVEELIGRSAIDTVFDLADATLRKDINDALEINHNLVSLNKKRPQEILGLLAWQFRTLLKAKRLLKGKTSLSRLAGELNVSDFFAKKVAGECSKTSASSIEKKLEFILSTDLAIKRGNVATPEYALELALVNLCGD
jgi:DNA polymerase-3 subunit delta